MKTENKLDRMITRVSKFLLGYKVGIFLNWD